MCVRVWWGSESLSFLSTKSTLVKKDTLVPSWENSQWFNLYLCSRQTKEEQRHIRNKGQTTVLRHPHILLVFSLPWIGKQVRECEVRRWVWAELGKSILPLGRCPTNNRWAWAGRGLVESFLIGEVCFKRFSTARLRESARAVGEKTKGKKDD